MTVLTDGAERYCGYTLLGQTTDLTLLHYLDAVEEFGGCPIDLVTNLGTENGTIVAMQAFIRDDPTAIGTLHRPAIKELRHVGVSFVSLALHGGLTSSITW